MTGNKQDQPSESNEMEQPDANIENRVLLTRDEIKQILDNNPQLTLLERILLERQEVSTLTEVHVDFSKVVQAASESTKMDVNEVPPELPELLAKLEEYLQAQRQKKGKNSEGS